MELRYICQRLDIKCPKSLENIEVEGITSNSKKVKRGYLFVCLSGGKNDGHHYIDEALMNGACAAVIENDAYLCQKAILVDSTRLFLAMAMNVFCDEPTAKMKFVGITGTNGKTSTASMLKNIFDEANISCEIIGTLNSSQYAEKCDDPTVNFTTPDPEILYPMLKRMADNGVKFVVMEASSHALFYEKLAPISFEIGIFTNLTEDHLDFHRSMEDYFKSKLKLFDACKLGIINTDDEYGKIIINKKYNTKTCSAFENADYYVKYVEKTIDGSKYTLIFKEKELKINCAVPGQFSIANSLYACACALELGIDEKIVQSAFDKFTSVEGRFEKFQAPCGLDLSVIIDYAHTPDALNKLLLEVNSFKREGQRTVLLFGCGGEREKEKRYLMGKIASQNADFVIITNDNPRSEDPSEIINEILLGFEGEKNFVVIPNRKIAIEFAIASHKAGDIVLLAGKGHEKYLIDKDGVHPFDERKILENAFKKYRKSKGGYEL